MNLADAIRQAAQLKRPEPEEKSMNVNPMGETPEKQSQPEAQFAEPALASGADQPAPQPRPLTVDAITTEPVAAPEPPSLPIAGGNVVRLELFLAPEQLSELFRAVAGTQHSTMTLREAARYLRISPAALDDMAREGVVPAVSIEGRWRFPKASLDEWLTLESFRSGGNSNVA
ncbi:MAG: helix-turn-helix domain-containing protein [Fimbriimonadaceae bacterium]|nr:MAG: Helix-turn-helix domain protein [Armatimonadetes bacterium OLB18]MCL4283817.1 helix-turn-helix domain-containing protein [Fimbriimonadaceae bacterium]QOJ11555.1 MAG: helix-turn-helix domain-containing protein [Chthonomonadaceae bacterium]RIK00272.1 MAG: hypothetical protein DCC46_05810 [Armatimonadota bacterium]MCZ7579870.1 helix-turn-helix domain-containing protein [Fimbriimonadaceae bacterium]